MTLREPFHPNAAPVLAAAHQIAPLIGAGEAVPRTALNQAMSEAFGTGSAEGIWTQRDSFQMLEAATILALRDLKCPADVVASTEFLAGLEARLPTQTVRSEEQVALHHFSTPLALSWLAGHLAAVDGNDTVLEPSAGIGMLAQWLCAAKGLHLNEINPLRAAILGTLFPDTKISSFDAAQIANHVTDRPSVIVMNPPFARSASGHIDGAAAARHLLSALKLLCLGGRLVAIMPDSFSKQGRNGELFARILQGHHVALHLRFEGAFAKHGTSVPIRVLVIDKVAGTFDAPVLCGSSLSELLPSITRVQQRQALTVAVAPTSAAPRSGSASGLFKAFSAPRAVARPISKPAPELMKAMDLPYSLREDIAGIGQDVGIYTDFRPQRLIFPTGSAHPSPLVESAAMASVSLPAPTVIPKLPQKVIEQGLLSTAQLETLVHALDATAQDLPGRYLVPEKGVELQPHAEGKIYRRGFFLGDGTGAGKGRQLAAVLMDQWLRGNRRHIWISDSSALIEDARRDWQALGGMALDIQPLAKIKSERPIGTGDTILFASYATMRSASGAKTRLQQILDWCGDEFEGLILFDEAHAMGGVAGGEGRFGATKGSQQGITGVELQNRLPRARVVYASATGASDINNLAYAVRLGLWGEGTAFPDRTAFITRIREGGIAAMELVARELKAMGVYTARALSYAGVEYDILEHQLSVEQIADFDAYADAWSVVHQNMEEALSAAGVIDQVDGRTLNGQALSAARSRFESSKQRFFGQLLLSMKLPTLLPAIARALEAEQSVVVQLVSTSEALLDRRLAELDPADRAELSVDLSPKELLLDYLNSAFPTRAMESYWDDEGYERSRPMSDGNGHPVHSQEALRIKADLIELLGAFPRHILG